MGVLVFGTKLEVLRANMCKHVRTDAYGLRLRPHLGSQLGFLTRYANKAHESAAYREEAPRAVPIAGHPGGPK